MRRFKVDKVEVHHPTRRNRTLGQSCRCSSAPNAGNIDAAVGAGVVKVEAGSTDSGRVYSHRAPVVAAIRSLTG